MKFQIKHIKISLVVMLALLIFGSAASAQQAMPRISGSINKRALNPQPLPPKKFKPTPPSPCLNCGNPDVAKRGSDRIRMSGNKSVFRSPVTILRHRD